MLIIAVYHGRAQHYYFSAYSTLLQRGEQTRNSNTSKKIIFFSYDVRAPRYAQGTDTSTIPTSDE